MSENNSIKPHGGILVNRITKVDPTGLFSITITEDLANDVENIADGIFSPLEGFLGRTDVQKIFRESNSKFHFDKQMHIAATELDIDELKKRELNAVLKIAVASIVSGIVIAWIFGII